MSCSAKTLSRASVAFCARAIERNSIWDTPPNGLMSSNVRQWNQIIGHSVNVESMGGWEYCGRCLFEVGLPCAPERRTRQRAVRPQNYRSGGECHFWNRPRPMEILRVEELMERQTELGFHARSYQHCKGLEWTKTAAALWLPSSVVRWYSMFTALKSTPWISPSFFGTERGGHSSGLPRLQLPRV